MLIKVEKKKTNYLNKIIMYEKIEDVINKLWNEKDHNNDMIWYELIKENHTYENEK